MTQSLDAHFDGKVIVPDEPVRLPVGAPLRVQVSIARNTVSPKRKAKRKISGLGKFASGTKDLGSNKRHLRGFGA